MGGRTTVTLPGTVMVAAARVSTVFGGMISRGLVLVHDLVDAVLDGIVFVGVAVPAKGPVILLMLVVLLRNSRYWWMRVSRVRSWMAVWLVALVGCICSGC